MCRALMAQTHSPNRRGADAPLERRRGVGGEAVADFDGQRSARRGFVGPGGLVIGLLQGERRYWVVGDSPTGNHRVRGAAAVELQLVPEALRVGNLVPPRPAAALDEIRVAERK